MIKKLADIYTLYPRKMGKTPGYKTAHAQCKTLEDLSLLEFAVKNYLAHLKREETEKDYILYFSTFMHQWRDWIEDDVGSVLDIKGRADLTGIEFDK